MRAAFSLTEPKLGMMMAVKIANTAITVKSSMSVNASVTRGDLVSKGFILLADRMSRG